MNAESVLDQLNKKSTARDRDNLKRFGIDASDALGVSMANIQALGRQIGRNHALALELWKTGCYEARLLASFVDEPERVTAGQMDRWCREFDNWAICDTLCFFLFDRTPHAWSKVDQWSVRPEEFVKRAGLALLASLAGHDKKAPDILFLERLPLIERAAADDRNFVKKGASWALRRIATRNQELKQAVLEVARRLEESKAPAARWIGRDTLRFLAPKTSKKRIQGAKNDEKHRNFAG